MTAPRLALLIGTHERVQTLLPALHLSRFVVAQHCLDADELLEAVEAQAIDAAVVSTGPRGVDQTVLAALARQSVPLVVLDSQPHHPRWSAFAGVVLLPSATAEQVLAGIEAALRGDRLRPIQSPAPGLASAEASGTGEGILDELPAVSERPADSPQVFAITSGHGAPGRSTVAGNLAFLLGQVAPTLLLDADLAAPQQAVYFRANTGKNLGTLAHAHPTDPAQWHAALGRDVQRLDADCPHGWLLAGLPLQEMRARVDGRFMDGLLATLRTRFRYVVIDTGLQWLDGDLLAAIPLQRADRVLLVAAPDLGGTQRALRALDALHRYLDAESVTVIVNQHRKHRDYDQSEMEFALGYRLSAVLPFDPAACWRAREEQRPVVLQGRTALGRSLIDFAERVHGGRVELPRPVHERRPASRAAARVPGRLRAVAARVAAAGGRS
jgi:MinD-like ATPase involved in chromosome partitioning or flagellar assembly